MFQGSKNASGEYFVYAEKAGANLAEGGVNGTTSNDRTNYFVTAPSGNLENLLWLESDRLATLARRHRPRRSSTSSATSSRTSGARAWKTSPTAAGSRCCSRTCSPNGHPYSWPVIGSQEDLSAATLDDVKEFFRQYYTPNNLSLVDRGRLRSGRSEALVEKYFGDMPPGPPLDRPARNIPTLDGEKVVEVNDRVSLERVYIGWPTPEYFAQDDAALDIAARDPRRRAVVAAEQGAGLRQAAGHAVSRVQHHRSRSPACSSCRPRRGRARRSTRFERVVAAEIARLAKDGPTVSRARARQDQAGIRVHLRPRTHRRLRRQGGRAQPVQHVPGRSRTSSRPTSQRYRALTPAAVSRPSRDWLDTPKRVVHPLPSREVARPAGCR